MRPAITLPASDRLCIDMRANMVGGVSSLRKLKEKLQQQRSHLDELEKHITELEGESKGEQ